VRARRCYLHIFDHLQGEILSYQSPDCSFISSGQEPRYLCRFCRQFPVVNPL
jgi:hypothetical protein